jgi:putative ABC transport system permease protein
MYGILFPVIGALLYQILLSLAMKYGYRIGFKPSDMKLLTALFVIAVIAVRRFKKSEVTV